MLGRRRWTSGLIAALIVLTLGVFARSARAGGNIQFRNPSNLSQVFNKLWDDRRLPLTWVLSSDGLPGSGLNNATLASELTAAFDTWESLGTSKLDFTFGGEAPLRDAGRGGPLGA